MTAPDAAGDANPTQQVKPATLESKVAGITLGSLIMRSDLTVALELASRHESEVIDVLQRLGALIAKPEDI